MTSAAPKKKKEKAPPKEEDWDANRKLLEEIAARPENSECFDCTCASPRWASMNFGVFLCIRCSGIHRSLGVHITKVRSVNLDKWTREQVLHMERIGNARGKLIYEARLPKGYKKPTEFTDNRMVESIMRQKWERKEFMADESTLASQQEDKGEDKKRERKDHKEKRDKKEKKERREKERRRERERRRSSSSSRSRSRTPERDHRTRDKERLDKEAEEEPTRSLEITPIQDTLDPVEPAKPQSPVGSEGVSEPTSPTFSKLRQAKKAAIDEFMAFAPPPAVAVQ
eukprot:TRINITY_DN81672_c0_g1_i1.p1 TRINITY_DN81672_c0_g1~~TRINITY_DN81672_c0_g1_i1.p1  ORF type:complete len:284 (-),score=56.58 TRINITY_DN81672_c0_g1_i1:130-981(-)